MSEWQVEADTASNVLRARMFAAANCAESSASTVAPGGNALARVISELELAWVSPSGARKVFIETLHGVGTVIPSTLRHHADMCRAEARAEPPEVDLDDPTQEWKAHGTRIDARVSLLSQEFLRSGRS